MENWKDFWTHFVKYAKSYDNENNCTQLGVKLVYAMKLRKKEKVQKDMNLNWNSRIWGVV